MPKYAVEIGKVVLRSEKPITDEERKEAIRLLGKNARLFPVAGGEVVVELRND